MQRAFISAVPWTGLDDTQRVLLLRPTSGPDQPILLS